MRGQAADGRCLFACQLLELPGFQQQRGLVLWTMQVLLKDLRPRSPTGGGGATGAARGEGGGRLGGGLFSDGEDGEREGSPASPHWHGDDVAPLSSCLDDEVVFLYRAVRGACTDSFGSHCAAAADMPKTVIERARHVSKCRLEGRPIERRDVDPSIAATKERAVASLVDSFLLYDFDVGTTTEFYAANDHLITQALATQSSAAAGG